MANRLLLIHGYSDTGASFERWSEILRREGFEPEKISVASYRTLTNEITIKDLAEGLDRAMRAKGIRDDEPFDAIVHSTGMLVLRAWLTAYSSRQKRLQRLIGLAPATFGSPLAHKGRGPLGALFKGQRKLGPDFLEAGDLVLDGLELGSRFTWDLAHLDLLADEPVFGPNGRTPWVFVFCGTQGYGGLRSVVKTPGGDGTVRWAGTSMDSRKVVVDLRDKTDGKERLRWLPAGEDRAFSPVQLVDGANHGTILREPSDRLAERVVSALRVATDSDFEAWMSEGRDEQANIRASLPELYQQFVVRIVDERGDPVSDYFVELVDGNGKVLEAFEGEVHAYRADPSFRCFHVDLRRLPADGRGLDAVTMRISAPTGSVLVSYHGVGGQRIREDGTIDKDAYIDAEVPLKTVLGNGGPSLFFPLTTTLVEIRLDREPMPRSAMPQIFELM